MLFYGLFNYMMAKDKRHEAALVNQGAAKERLDANQEVLNRVEKANDVERNPSANLTSSVRCKYDRSANCQ